MASVNVRVTGADQLSRVAKALAEKGNGKALKRRMAKGIRKAAKPITDEQKVSLAAGLPKSGGAAATISGETKISVRTTSDTVTITDAWRGHNMRLIDAGSLRHPLYGDRSHWYTTSITPGLLSGPVERNRPMVEIAIVAELDLMAEEIAREA